MFLPYKGFDEYLNLVLDKAVEYDRKTKATKELGKILLKGENIVLVRTLEYFYYANLGMLNYEIMLI